MGQYILCTGELAKQPFHIKEIGLHLYSGEELCYYIFHNLALIDENFISKELLHFIEIELDMKECANRIRRMLEPQATTAASLNQILVVIMREMKYYNEEEMAEFGEKLDAYKKMTDLEHLMARADALLERKKYNSAISVYENYLNSSKTRSIKGEDLEKAWQHCAVVYLRMYLYEQALACLMKAYEIKGSSDILKQMYFLSIMQDVELPADFFTVESPETLTQWQEEYKEIRDAASDSLSNSRIAMVMKKDSVRREQELIHYLDDLKHEYRLSE